MTRSGDRTAESALGAAELLADADRPGGWLLLVDRIRQSYVDLDDPTYLDFEYVQAFSDVLDALPEGPLAVTHIGGGACTLARYVHATRPGSPQIVLEPDVALTALVRARLPLPRGSRVRIRPLDGRTGVAALADSSADVVVLDAFAGGRVPPAGAARGPRDVLDVGCGTGKAARLLAARGFDVLGVEIDAGMAAVAREHGLDVEVAGFEAWDDAGRRFDLVTCGQAWHWIDPEAGAAKARRVLRAGGALALFWNMHELDPAVRAALDDVYAEHAPELPGGERHHSGRHVEKYVGELERAGFGRVSTHDYPWQRVYRRGEWLDLVSTYSNHALLPPGRLARLQAAIGGVVDRAGGAITARYTTNLVLARTPSK